MPKFPTAFQQFISSGFKYRPTRPLIRIENVTVGYQWLAKVSLPKTNKAKWAKQ
jgi:hypothetical protein